MEREVGLGRGDHDAASALASPRVSATSSSEPSQAPARKRPDTRWGREARRAGRGAGFEMAGASREMRDVRARAGASGRAS